MRTIDVPNEALIDAPAQEVNAGFVDERYGRTSWWAPHHTVHLVTRASFDQVGSHSKVAKGGLEELRSYLG